MGRGKPLKTQNPIEQCEAITVLTDWKRRQKVQDLRCEYFARLQVGKKRLCYRHALLEALATCIADHKASILPNPAARQRYTAVPTVDIPNE